MTETALMREILTTLCQLEGGLFWRVNVGVVRSFDGRTMRFGMAGQADIAGCYRGRHVEVEVKTDKGRLSEAQKRWKNAVESVGGLYVVARRPGDALNALMALDGSRRSEPTPLAVVSGKEA